VAADAQSARTPLRIGLTGGIASGKSTVADLFVELGAAVIDADVIAREVVMPGRPGLNDVRQAFGEQVISDDGRLNRAVMRQLVFADDDARKQLEAILHPRIREEMVRQTEAAGGDYQLVVVPLLATSPLRYFVDRVLVVDCEEDTQISRLLARDAESEEQARRILAAQTSREVRLSIADDIIDNDVSLDALRSQVAALHKFYLKLRPD